MTIACPRTAAALTLAATLAPGVARATCDVAALAAGARHSLAATAEGTLYAWGQNDHGQLGDATLADRDVPVRIEIEDVIGVAAGGWHSLALRHDGTVWAWGFNGFGQLTRDPEVLLRATSPVQVLVDPSGIPLDGAIAIAAGSHHALALLADGRILAWGENGAGQLGDGTTAGTHRPVVVSIGGAAVRDATAIAAGHAHSLALLADGTVLTWGYNGDGQLGRATGGSLDPVPGPAALGGGAGIKTIAGAACGNFSLALAADGEVWGWGAAPAGSTIPAPVAGLTSIKAIAAGAKHLLALRDDGRVLALGKNTLGQTAARGPGASPVLETSSAPAELAGVSRIAAGGLHSLAFQATGDLRSWGGDERGQLGNDAPTLSSETGWEVHHVALACSSCVKTFIQVAAGRSHTVALLGDGRVMAWGLNQFGQLGNGTQDDAGLAESVLGLTGIVAVAAGADISAALASDGRVWTWGDNLFGQLGVGRTGDFATVPELVVDAGGAPFEGAIGIAAGSIHMLALRSNGEAWAWGANRDGQLGDGASNRDSPVPIQVRTSVPFRSVAAGSFHSLAVGGTGEAWAWGDNMDGQLGDGTGVDAAVPVSVADGVSGGPLGLVTDLDGGTFHSLARRATGGIWSWGRNDRGQLGDGTRVGQSRAVPSRFADARGLAAGSEHSLAVSGAAGFGGTLWSWGANAWGQLGDGTRTDALVPVQVLGTVASGRPALDRVTAATGGGRHSHALLATGSVVGFGANERGQLGRPVPQGGPTIEPVPIDLGDFDPLPPDQGNVIRGAKVLPLHVQMDWRLARNLATYWALYRDVMKEMVGRTEYLRRLAAPQHLDANAISPSASALLFYQVRGLSPYCLYAGPP